MLRGPLSVPGTGASCLQHSPRTGCRSTCGETPQSVESGPRRWPLPDSAPSCICAGCGLWAASAMEGVWVCLLLGADPQAPGLGSHEVFWLLSAGREDVSPGRTFCRLLHGPDSICPAAADWLPPLPGSAALSCSWILPRSPSSEPGPLLQPKVLWGHNCLF